MSLLFSPFKLKDIVLKNRIAVAPMCQYSAEDGMANDWHLSHYSKLAQGGAGLVMVESTAVSPEGRITPYCLGIWNDKQAESLAKIAKAIKSMGAIPGIQIAHAGRKANTNRPWEGDDHIADNDPRYWQILAPSDIAFGQNLPRVPKMMSKSDINRVTNDFAKAAERAYKAGFEWLEVHFAHGYLAQSFFSSHSNHRTDEYGGGFIGRSRFLIETLQAVRSIWPENRPLASRFGVIEYDGKDLETTKESIQLVKKLKTSGLDFLNMSLGFSTPEANIPWGPGFLAPIAKQIKCETHLPVATAWGLESPALAEHCIVAGDIDLVMIGRMMLENPNYPYKMAKILGIEQKVETLPIQYTHWLKNYQSGVI